VNKEAIFINGDLADVDLLEELFREYRIESVVHLAARTLVGESVTNPRLYFENNLVCGLNLLNAMCKYQVQKIVFSSSCAVYGQPRNSTITEDTPRNPINPYGEAKLALERVLYWYAGAYGLSSISLRYFNAAGASLHSGEDHNPETHLIPNVIRVALGQVKNVTVFGADYPTTDGSCIRDYVHVIDIALAHKLALQKLDKPGICRAYNLGNGKGYSVLEVIDVTRKITGAVIPVIISERRPGDPPILVANASLARAELGWEPSRAGLDVIIKNAYDWMKNHPDGYKTLTRDAKPTLHKD
jgi:UDP-glucose 4-epimerase